MGFYVIETDGFVIDRMLGRWNDRYAFLTFAGDHGLYVDCEAYGNGGLGAVPGRRLTAARRSVNREWPCGMPGWFGNS